MANPAVAAVVASAVIGAGAQTAIASKQRSATQRLADAEAAQHRKDRMAQAREQERKLAADRLSSQLATDQVRKLENMQSGAKGIAQRGSDMSAAILNEDEDAL